MLKEELSTSLNKLLTPVIAFDFPVVIIITPAILSKRSRFLRIRQPRLEVMGVKVSSGVDVFESDNIVTFNRDTVLDRFGIVGLFDLK
jgi:hypothetical protein